MQQDEGADPKKGQGDRGRPDDEERPWEGVAGGGAVPGPQQPTSSEAAEAGDHSRESHTFGGVPVTEGHMLLAHQAVWATAGPGHVMEFTMSLPFLPSLDSQVALQYFIMGAHNIPGPVHLEFAISGSDLHVRLRCADSDLLRVYAAALLNKLTHVMRAMQTLPPTGRGRPRRP